MKSPPPWDYLLGFGLLVVLAGLAIWKSWTMIADGEHDGDVFLLGWLILNALLLYAPTGLQRRLSIGLILPLAVFAARGLSRVVLPTVRRRWRPLLMAGAFILIAPSTVVALAVPVQGIVTHDALYYLSQEELDGLEWISENVAPDEVVLASPNYSLFIPAYGQSRVVYGHDFETIRADERKAAVESFFDGSDCDVVTSEAVSYIVFGPREDALGGGCQPDDEAVYSSDDITIYRVGR